jgi:tetratricopeptide (TPR) repeat protein
MSKKNRQQLISLSNKAMESAQYLKAITYLTDLIKHEVNNQEFLKARSDAFIKTDQFALALNDLAKLVEADPNNQISLLNFGVSLLRCNKTNEALEIFLHLLDLDPKNFGAHLNLCEVYQRLDRPSDQLSVAVKAVAINPQNSMAYVNLGSALGDLKMIAESREAFLTAIALDPKNFNANVNLAMNDLILGNYYECITSFEKILNSENLSVDEEAFVRWTISSAYLQIGQLEKGWLNYEFGFGLVLGPKGGRSLEKFPEPKWRGQDLSGKTLIVLREQGLGDEILFSTMYSELEELNTNIIVQCDARLIDIFQRTYTKLNFVPEGVQLEISDENKVFRLAAGSLMGFFRKKIIDFNRPIKSLIPDSNLVLDLKNRLSAYKNKKLVGICWRSGKLLATRNDFYSVLTDWGELLKKPRLQFVSLQYGDCEAEVLDAEKKFGIKILRWPDIDLKNDLEHVFALIKNLDAVVSVTSAPAPMAGAVGTKTYILSSRYDWVFLGENRNYPWFPNNEFFVPQQPNSHFIDFLPEIGISIENLA